MNQNVDKTKYFSDALISCKLLKLVDNISNQFNHQWYLTLLLIMSEIKIENNRVVDNIFHRKLNHDL